MCRLRLLTACLMLPLLAPAAAAAAAGDILVADAAVGVVRVSPVSGARSLVSAIDRPNEPGLGSPRGIAVAPDGHVFVATSTGVVRVNPATGARAFVSANGAPSGGPDFADPEGLAIAAGGDLIVADAAAFGGTGGLIRVNPTTGARSVLSSNAAPAGGPSFQEPSAVAVAAGGDLFVVDTRAFDGFGGVIRVNPATGARSAVSANGAPAGGPGFVAPADLVQLGEELVVVDAAAQAGAPPATGAVIRVNAATGARTLVSSSTTPPGMPAFKGPRGIVLAPDGALLVAEPDAFADDGGGIVRVDPATGARSVLSSNDAPPGGPSFGGPWKLAIERPFTAPPVPPPPPPASARVRPGALTLAARARRGAITAAGRLVLPAGARCEGPVTVTITRGGRRVARTTVALRTRSGACRYSARLRPKRAARRTTLRVRARFAGSATLLPRTSPVRTIRLPR